MTPRGTREPTGIPCISYQVLIREDAKQRVVASGLAYDRCDDAAACLDAIKRGAAERTTSPTEVNQASSRSHGICEIVLRDADGRVHGSVSLIDLAGEEGGEEGGGRL